MDSYTPGPKVLPQCAANISSLNTHVKLMRQTVDDTHEFLHKEIMPVLITLQAAKIKKKKPNSLLRAIVNSTLTKALIAALTMIGLALFSMFGCEEENMAHRIEDVDAVVESGKNRFINQDLAGGVNGTTDRAESSNMFQEEICNVVELTGGTVAATAAADRTANWRQLYDRIFQSAVIDSAAIDNISVSKLSDGTISINSGETPTPDNVWTQSNEEIIYRLNGTNTWREMTLSAAQLYHERKYDEAGSPIDMLALSLPSGLQIEEIDDATNSVVIAHTDYRARGVKYEQRFGTSTDFAEAVYRKEAFEVTSVSWSGSGPYTGAFTNFDTGLPWDTKPSIVSAWVQGTDADSAFLAPATLSPTQAGSTVWLANVQLDNASIPTGTTIELIVEYDASELSD